MMLEEQGARRDPSLTVFRRAKTRFNAGLRIPVGTIFLHRRKYLYKTEIRLVCYCEESPKEKKNSEITTFLWIYVPAVFFFLPLNIYNFIYLV